MARSVHSDGLELRRARGLTLAHPPLEAQVELRFLTDDLLGAASPDVDGKAVTVLELLDRAGPRVDVRFADRPLVAATVHHSLGESYAALGSFDLADRHLSRAVALRRAASGPDSVETLHSEIAVASLLARRQDFHAARDALVALVERGRRLLHPDDAALYAALNDLGVVQLSLGDAGSAVELLREALAGRRRLLPPGDMFSAMTAINLAGAYGAQGDALGALDMQVQTLTILDAGGDPPFRLLLGLENNVGATLQDLGRDAEARPHLERAAALAFQWLGAEHPDTLTLRQNLASLEADLGDLDRALALFEELVAMRSATLGPVALDTLSTRHGYWSTVRKARRFDEAAAGFAELLADVTTAFDADHPLAAQTASSLARALLDGGRPAEALPHAQRAALRLGELFGPDHVRTQTAREMVADIQGS